MDPITIALLAGAAYVATRKPLVDNAPPNPSGGGDAIKPNDQGPAKPIDVTKENGNGKPEQRQAVQRKANARISKALKTSNFSQLTLAELNQINPATLRNEAEQTRFILVKKRAAAAEAKKKMQ